MSGGIQNMVHRNIEHKNKVTETTKQQQEKKKGPLIYIIWICSICVIFVGAFWACYSYVMNDSYSDYETKVNKSITAINKANSGTAILIKSSTIDTEKTPQGLSAIINGLQTQKDAVSALTPTDKYKSPNASLIQGITSNMGFYSQLSSVLKNPNSSDIATSLDNLSRLKSDTVNFYKEASVNRLQVSLTSDTNKFMDNSIAYVNQLVKLQKNQEITSSQLTDFIKAMDDSFKNFQSIKTDYKAEVLNIRAGLGSYDALINEISDNKNKLANLKVDLAKASIPSKTGKYNPLDIFNSLKGSLDDYDSYLDAFTYALANEKAQASNGKIDNDAMAKLYTTADSKMSKVVTDYNSFVQSYNNFKTSK